MKFKVTVIILIFSAIFTFGNYTQQKDFPVLKGPFLGQKPPGDVPELFMPGIISNCDLHSSVYFSADGKEVCFSKLKEPIHSGPVINFARRQDGSSMTADGTFY